MLDSGVLDRATTDREFRALLRDLIDGGWDPIVPTVVLAEAITGRPIDAPVNQIVRRVGTTDTSEATARRAGQLRNGPIPAGRRTPSGIDAIVAAHAAEAAAGVVFTTDPTDLRRLLTDFSPITIEKP